MEVSPTYIINKPKDGGKILFPLISLHLTKVCLGVLCGISIPENPWLLLLENLISVMVVVISRETELNKTLFLAVNCD